MGRLESEGRFRLVYERSPLRSGRTAALRQLVKEEAPSGRTIWVSFN